MLKDISVPAVTRVRLFRYKLTLGEETTERKEKEKTRMYLAYRRIPIGKMNIYSLVYSSPSDIGDYHLPVAYTMFIKITMIFQKKKKNLTLTYLQLITLRKKTPRASNTHDIITLNSG